MINYLLLFVLAVWNYTTTYLSKFCWLCFFVSLLSCVTHVVVATHLESMFVSIVLFWMFWIYLSGILSNYVILRIEKCNISHSVLLCFSLLLSSFLRPMYYQIHFHTSVCYFLLLLTIYLYLIYSYYIPYITIVMMNKNVEYFSQNSSWITPCSFQIKTPKQ